MMSGTSPASAAVRRSNAGAPLVPALWQRDEAATQCKGCALTFGISRRKHHCRGCGLIYCSECLRAAPLEQYGLDAEPLQQACRGCASPFVHVGAAPPLLPTAGGDLLLEVFNVGATTASPLSVTWAGAAVVSAELVKTSAGLRLRVPVPAGVGLHTLTLACRGAAAKSFGDVQLSASVALAYSPPAILRVAPLRTEGGELTIFGENFGAASTISADATATAAPSTTTAPGVVGGDASAAADAAAADAAAAALQLQQVQVLIDGVPATDVRVKQAHKKLSCVAPPGTGISTVTVIVGGQACTADALHASPEISALEPPDVDMTGGVLTIVGRSFGVDAALVQVVLPDFGVEATDVHVSEAETRVSCALPPLPAGAVAGEPLRLRIIVGGVHSITPAFVVFCPPGGAPAAGGRPAYLPKRFSYAARKGPLAVPSPYADLFSTDLSGSRANKGGASGGAGAAPAVATASPTAAAAVSPSSPAPAAVTATRAPSVRVGGTLSGGGPTLSIAAPSAWAPDADKCDSCAQEFGLSRRRHHCRICGCCVCADCSPHQLQLAPTKPAVRVCTKCNLRVGLLNQMTAVVDSIYSIKKLLPQSMFHTFQKEVLDAVGGDALLQRQASVSAAAAAALPAVATVAPATPTKAE